MEPDILTSRAIDELAARYNLTRREQEALSGIAAGLTNRELATRMKISPNTVKAFLHILMIKMGLSTRADVAAAIAKAIHEVEAEPATTPDDRASQHPPAAIRALNSRRRH
jgi:DNA-binding NarL/FixJ family response regulator